MAKAIEKRVDAYTRCAGCRRLLEKVNAQYIEGAPYGSECAPKARVALMALERDLTLAAEDE